MWIRQKYFLNVEICFSTNEENHQKLDLSTTLFFPSFYSSTFNRAQPLSVPFSLLSASTFDFLFTNFYLCHSLSFAFLTFLHSFSTSFVLDFLFFSFFLSLRLSASSSLYLLSFDLIFLLFPSLPSSFLIKSLFAVFLFLVSFSFGFYTPSYFYPC